MSLFSTCAEQPGRPGPWAQRGESSVPGKSGPCTPFCFALSFPRVAVQSRGRPGPVSMLTSRSEEQRKAEVSATAGGGPTDLSGVIYDPLFFLSKIIVPSAEVSSARAGSLYYCLWAPSSQSSAWYVENAQWAFGVNGYLTGGGLLLSTGSPFPPVYELLFVGGGGMGGGLDSSQKLEACQQVGWMLSLLSKRG